MATESIIKTEPGVCLLCGKHGQTQKHHLMSGAANRRLSEEDGLFIYVCPMCHEMIHRFPEINRTTKQFAEKVWRDYYGKSKEEFIKRYGKSFEE